VLDREVNIVLLFHLHVLRFVKKWSFLTLAVAILKKGAAVGTALQALTIVVPPTSISAKFDQDWPHSSLELKWLKWQSCLLVVVITSLKTRLGSTYPQYDSGSRTISRASHAFLKKAISFSSDAR
jgi:hypothetical protein